MTSVDEDDPAAAAAPPEVDVELDPQFPTQYGAHEGKDTDPFPSADEEGALVLPEEKEEKGDEEPVIKTEEAVEQTIDIQEKYKYEQFLSKQKIIEEAEQSGASFWGRATVVEVELFYTCERNPEELFWRDINFDQDLCKEMIFKHKIFRDTSVEFRRKISDKLTKEGNMYPSFGTEFKQRVDVFFPGTSIGIQGSWNTDLHFVYKGSVDMFIQESLVKTLNEGESFGLMSFCSISSREACSLKAGPNGAEVRDLSRTVLHDVLSETYTREIPPEDEEGVPTEVEELLHPKEIEMFDAHRLISMFAVPKEQFLSISIFAWLDHTTTALILKDHAYEEYYLEGDTVDFDTNKIVIPLCGELLVTMGTGLQRHIQPGMIIGDTQAFGRFADDPDLGTSLKRPNFESIKVVKNAIVCTIIISEMCYYLHTMTENKLFTPSPMIYEVIRASFPVLAHEWKRKKNENPIAGELVTNTKTIQMDNLMASADSLWLTQIHSDHLSEIRDRREVVPVEAVFHPYRVWKSCYDTSNHHPAGAKTMPILGSMMMTTNDIIRKLHYFKGFDNPEDSILLTCIAATVDLIVVGANEVFCTTKQDAPDNLYIVVWGSLLEMSGSTVTRTLTRGMKFNELGFFRAIEKFTCTIKNNPDNRGDAILARLNRQSVEQVLRPYSSLCAFFLQQERSVVTTALMPSRNILRNVPMFQHAPQNLINRIFKYALRESYFENEIIFKPGDPANSMYLVTGGVARGVEYPESLYRMDYECGDWVGQNNLIGNDDGRHFALIASTNVCVVLVIHRSVLLKQLSRYSTFEKKITLACKWNVDLCPPLLDQLARLGFTEEFLHEIRRYQHPCVFAKKSIISMKKNRILLVMSGEIHRIMNHMVITTYKPRDYINDLCFWIQGLGFAGTLVAATECDCISISLDDIMSVLKRYPQNVKRYNAFGKSLTGTTFDEVPLFMDTSKQLRRFLDDNSTHEIRLPGETMCREGDHDDWMFILRSGDADASCAGVLGVPPEPNAVIDDNMMSMFPSERKETIQAATICWIQIVQKSVWRFIPDYFPKEMEMLHVKIAKEKLKHGEKVGKASAVVVHTESKKNLKQV